MDETFKRIAGEYYDSIGDDDHIFDRETFIQVLWLSIAIGMYTGHSRKDHRDL